MAYACDMDRGTSDALMVGVFGGGLYALQAVPRWVATRIVDEPLGQYWVACLPALPLMLGYWLAVPWLMRLQGGAAVLDEEMRGQVDDAERPWFWRKLLEGNLRAKSPRLRHGYLALMPLPALLAVTTGVVMYANSALSGTYEEANCDVIRSWKFDGKWSRAFVCRRSIGEALEEGLTEGPRPDHFTARVRRGALGVWLLDGRSVRSY
jgi:hypothetical protein